MLKIYRYGVYHHLHKKERFNLPIIFTFLDNQDMYKIAVDALAVIRGDSSKNEASRGKITRNNGCIHEKEEEETNRPCSVGT